MYENATTQVQRYGFPNHEGATIGFQLHPPAAIGTRSLGQYVRHQERRRVIGIGCGTILRGGHVTTIIAGVGIIAHNDPIPTRWKPGISGEAVAARGRANVTGDEMPTHPLWNAIGTSIGQRGLRVLNQVVGFLGCIRAHRLLLEDLASLYTPETNDV